MIIKGMWNLTCHKALTIILFITAAQEYTKRFPLGKRTFHCLTADATDYQWLNLQLHEYIYIFHAQGLMLLLKNRYKWNDVNGQTRSTKYGTRAKVYTLSGINTVQKADILCKFISHFNKDIVDLCPYDYRNWKIT